MARYKVLERSCIDGIIFEEGEECDYDGLPSANLEPIDADAKKAAKTKQDLDAAADLAAANATPAV